MAESSAPIIDVDNHYYEVSDAFTRHLPREMSRRGVQWAEINGRRRLLVAGKVFRSIGNPTFDPIARPGSLIDFFRGQNTEGSDVKDMFGQLDSLSDHPEYVDRDARLKVLAEQKVDAAFMFPTLGVLVQKALTHDIDALHATYHAFNEWLLEDWGFDAPLYSAPVILLADPLKALAEVNWALEHGAQLLGMIPGPVPNAHGGTRSPASADLDPVWQRINDAGVLVGFHGTDGILDKYLSEWERPDDGFAIFASAFKMTITHGRPISDTIIALICHGLFTRFPNLRIATIETGSNWVQPLLHDLAGTYGKLPRSFHEDPVETFKRHFWVSPFFEDDITTLRDLIGAENMLFGSDWPHAEGLATPRDYFEEIPTFSEADTAAVMGANAAELIVPRPV